MSSIDRFFFRGSGSKFIEGVSDWTYEVPAFAGLHSLDRSRYTWAGIGNWTHVAGSTVIDSQVASNRVLPGRPVQAAARVQADRHGPAVVSRRVLRSRRNDCMLPVIGIGGYQGISSGATSGDSDDELPGHESTSRTCGAPTRFVRASTRDWRNASAAPGQSVRQSVSSPTSSRARPATPSQLTPSNLGLSMAAFMLGIPSTVVGHDSEDVDHAEQLSTGYTGRIRGASSRNLTLNVGLRFEWENGVNGRSATSMLVDFDPTAQLAISDAGGSGLCQGAARAAAGRAFPRARRVGLRHGSRPGRHDLEAGNAVDAARSFGLRSWARRRCLRAATASTTTPSTPTTTPPTCWATAPPPRTPTARTSDRRSGSAILRGRARHRRSVPGPRGRDPLRRAGRRVTRARYGRRVGVSRPRTATASTPGSSGGVSGSSGSSLSNLSVEVAYEGSYSDRIDISSAGLSARSSTWIPGSLNARDATTQAFLVGTMTNPFALANFAALQVLESGLYQRMASTNAFFSRPPCSAIVCCGRFSQINNLDVRQPAARESRRCKRFSVNVNRRFSGGLTANAALAFTNSRSNRTSRSTTARRRCGRRTTPAGRSASRRARCTSCRSAPASPMLSDGGFWSPLAGGWQTAGTFEYQPGSLSSSTQPVLLRQHGGHQEGQARDLP